MNLITWPTFLSPAGPALLAIAAKSLAILGAALVAVRLMPRASAAARHFTLSLAVGSLLLLPILSSTLPRMTWLPGWMESRPAATAGGISVSPVSIEATATKRGEAPVATAPLAGAATFSHGVSLSLPKATPNPSASGSLRWVAVAWLVGLAAVLVPAVVGLVSLRRLRLQSHREETGPLRDLLNAVAADVGITSPVRLLLSAERRMPMTWGLFRPLILLPVEAREWPVARQRIVLLHELAHIQRRDFAVTLAARVACACYWFNPLVWLAVRRLRLEQESACDDLVLRHGAASDGYAEELLQIAAGEQGIVAGNLGALAMARTSSLEPRLVAILDRGRNRAALTRRGLATGLSFAVLLVAPVAMMHAGQGVAPDRPSSPSQPSPTSNSNAAPGVFHRDPARGNVLVAAVSAAQSTEGKEAGTIPGLIAWWRAEGDGKDSVGEHDGDFPFGIRYLPGMKGKAFDFRRSFAIKDILPRVNIPDSPAFQLADAFTLEAWIRPLRFGGIVLFRGDDRVGLDNWQLDLITPGKISFNFDDPANKSAEVLAPIELNKWQHVVATFDQGAMRIYLNAALVAEAHTPLRPNTVLDPNRGAALGIGNTGGKEYTIPFDGLIDEVRVYNRALSAAEIAEQVKR